jgi:hypothetical protein
LCVVSSNIALLTRCKLTSGIVKNSRREWVLGMESGVIYLSSIMY